MSFVLLFQTLQHEMKGRIGTYLEVSTVLLRKLNQTALIFPITAVLILTSKYPYK